MSVKRANLICCVGGISVTVGCAVCSTLISNSNTYDSEQVVDKPLGRGNNYEYWSLKYALNSTANMASLCVTEKINNVYVKTIDSKNFKAKFINVMRTTLHSMTKFSANYNNYKIKLTYKILDSKDKVNVDVVWYLESDFPYYFYDQFQISVV
ncbi:MAG: hypothetical protein LBM76_01655 [Mycoplasmataceae bacterium]|jgi:hypothetical protein|nr:hypothetical protein [Mycoplasmataceae bacterium]